MSNIRWSLTVRGLRVFRALALGGALLAPGVFGPVASAQTDVARAEQKAVAPSRAGFVNSVNGPVTIRPDIDQPAGGNMVYVFALPQ